MINLTTYLCTTLLILAVWLLLCLLLLSPWLIRGYRRHLLEKKGREYSEAESLTHKIARDSGMSPAEIDRAIQRLMELREKGVYVNPPFPCSTVDTKPEERAQERAQGRTQESTGKHSGGAE